MKNTVLYLLLSFIIALNGCKKEEVSNPDNTDNNNHNNQPDTRVGLERLTNPNSTNYCVVIIGTDTSIWQTGVTDTIETTGGISEEFPASYYYYITGTCHNNLAGARLKTFKLEFERYTDFAHYYNHSGNCSTPDSVVVKGCMPEDTTLNARYRFYVSITDSMDTWAITRLQTGAYINITSATPVPTSTGCIRLRVKGTLNNVNLYNSICGPVPVFQVKQAAFQMDFKWPG